MLKSDISHNLISQITDAVTSYSIPHITNIQINYVQTAQQFLFHILFNQN